MRFAVAVIVLVIGCSSTQETVRCPTYYAPPIQRPFVWRITAPGGGSFVLFATHQAASDGDVPAIAWAELDRAELYVAEADEVPDDAMRDPALRELFMLPRGSSLQTMLGDADYSELTRRTGRMAHAKPWVAMLRLVATAYEFPSPNENAALLERAHDKKLAVEFLDTWEEQARYLDAAITPAKLSGMIHDYPKIGCAMGNRVNAYRAGDDAVFMNEIASADEPVVPRIARWFVKLEGIAASGKHGFVALGVGQILGPYGLLAKFAERGYRVERLGTNVASR